MHTPARTETKLLRAMNARSKTKLPRIRPFLSGLHPSPLRLRTVQHTPTRGRLHQPGPPCRSFHFKDQFLWKHQFLLNGSGWEVYHLRVISFLFPTSTSFSKSPQKLIRDCAPRANSNFPTPSYRQQHCASMMLMDEQKGR